MGTTESLACVTGAAGGLGRAVAARCAALGYHLFLTDVLAGPLEALAAGLRDAHGVRVLFGPCDLSDPESRRVLFDRFEREGLRFHFLANVAGVDHEGRFVDLTAEQIRAMVRVNIEGALDVTHRLVGLRDPGRTFRIVNVCSLAAFYPMPVKAAYAASKRFLLDFSIALREELRGEDVTVTALCPAGMPTTPVMVRAIEAQGPAGRLTTLDADTVAAVAVASALKGRAVVVPGFLNRLLRRAGAVFPPRFAARVIGLRWGAVSASCGGRGRQA